MIPLKASPRYHTRSTDDKPWIDAGDLVQVTLGQHTHFNALVVQRTDTQAAVLMHPDSDEDTPTRLRSGNYAVTWVQLTCCKLLEG